MFQPKEKALGKKLYRRLLNARRDGAAVQDCLELIRRGADVNYATSGDSVLDAAVKVNGMAPVIRALIDGGATLEKSRFHSPLEIAIYYERFNNYEVLVEKGADIHALNRSGENMLVYALKSGCLSIAQDLFMRGLDIHQQSEKGMNAVYAATYSGRADHVAFALEKGANPNVIYNGETALHRAVASNNEEALCRLLAAGADGFIRNADGRNAYEYAREREARAPIMDALRKFSLDPGIAEDWRVTGDMEVAHVAVKAPLGLQITEIFNFSSQTYTQVIQDIAHDRQSHLMRTFSECGDFTMIPKAAERLAQLTGQAVNWTAASPLPKIRKGA